MKKLSFLLLAAAGLTLASCSQDEVAPATGTGDGNFSITVNLPNRMHSRAVSQFGEGTVAQKLNVAVYDGTTGTLVQDFMTEFPAGQLSTTVDFSLVRGKSYNIVFFAQSAASMNTAADGQPSNAVYTFDAANKTMTVDYANMTSAGNLDDDYDCFYNVLPTGVIGSTTMTTSVLLNRPVGQINWGTDDLTYNDENGETQDMIAAHDEAFGSQGQYIETFLTITPYTTLNLLTGEVSGNTNEVTIGAFAAPYTLAFPLEDVTASDYIYVAMAYVLAPKANSTLYDLGLTIENNSNPNIQTNPDLALSTEVEVDAAPVQANFQTNIYGNLLSDNVSVKVTKNKVWETPDYEVPLTWDGSTVTYPAINTENKTGVVNQASDLAGLAELVKTNDYAGYTFTLGADLDMGGNNLPSIGSAEITGSGNAITGVTGTAFAGTFDGQNHTISNFAVSVAADDAATSVAGLFPYVKGGTIQNVNFANVNISNTMPIDDSSYPTIEQYFNATGVVGILDGGTLNNVNVTSGTVDGYNNVAGVVGYVKSGSVTSCKNAAEVSGASNAGGVVGNAYAATPVSITSCSNSGNVSAVFAAAGVVGYSNANVSQCTNTGNVSGIQFSIGGIVGEQRTSGSVKNCENTGNVTVTDPSNPYGAGGIVGWIRYIQINPDIQTPEVIVVDTNTNKGTIKGGVGAGGIVGIWYATGTCSNNTNNAPAISAFVAGAGGIVGQTNPTTQNWAPNNSVDLTVSGNTTTTTWDNLSSPVNNQGAEQRGLLVGINDGYVTLTGNTPSANTPQ